MAQYTGKIGYKKGEGFGQSHWDSFYSVWRLHHRHKKSSIYEEQKESCSAWLGALAHGKVKITQHIGREISLSSHCACGEVSHTIHGGVVCGLHFTRGNGVSVIGSHSLESVTRSHSAWLGKFIESQATLWDGGITARRKYFKRHMVMQVIYYHQYTYYFFFFLPYEMHSLLLRQVKDTGMSITLSVLIKRLSWRCWQQETPPSR